MKNYTRDNYEKDLKTLSHFNINLLWDKSFWGLSQKDSITAVATDTYTKLRELLKTIG